jgi:hypothetical protein
VLEEVEHAGAGRHERVISARFAGPEGLGDEITIVIERG